MTTHELAKKLLELPDVMVLTDGYEGGVDEITKITPTKIKLNVHDEWYYGNHDVLAPYELNDSSINATDAILLSS
jgi:hypothetical protein